MRAREASRILIEAKRLAPRLVAWRRHIHMYPEPSMEEHETAAYVVEQLRALGVDHIQTGVGKTGVVALIRGQGRKTVGLRADMDALELTEETEAPYRSRKPGFMHACGHDGHTACLLGAAAILQQMRDRLPGNVKLIFQPGEEGPGGARYMIEDGVLEKPKLRAIACLHVDSEVPSGKVGIRRGYDTAQTDDIHIVIKGRSGHAAAPHKGVDSISVTAQALIAIQQFIARHTNAIDRKLLTIAQIHGGTRHNILADQVEMIGTIRTLEPKGREMILKFVKRDLRKLVGAMGAGLRVKVTEGYPPALNDDRVVDIFSEMGEKLLGDRNVVDVPQPSLGGEDFAYFGRAGLPAALLRLGIRDEKKGFTAPGHNSRFDFDDRRVLPIGTAMLTATAWRMLETF